jgi:hypothetical protein
MLRNPVSEFTLSRAGKASGPRPSFKPALEALEERVVLSQNPVLAKMTALAQQMGQVQIQLGAHEITAGQALQEQQALERQFQKLQRSPEYRTASHGKAFRAEVNIFQARATAVGGEALAPTPDGGSHAPAASRSGAALSTGDGADGSTNSRDVGVAGGQFDHPPIGELERTADGKYLYGGQEYTLDDITAKFAQMDSLKEAAIKADNIKNQQLQQSADKALSGQEQQGLQQSFDQLSAKANQLGCTNLLAGVKNPDGSINPDNLQKAWNQVNGFEMQQPPPNEHSQVINTTQTDPNC